MGGPVAVQRREDPVVLRQRPEGLLSRLSSGKHGDIFRFLMETEGLSFPDAVERLAGMTGVPLPRQTSAEVEQEKKRASFLDVLAMAARLFEANLQGPAGARARGYLSDRGLGSAVQQRFSLGYSAPDRFALRDALAAQGVGADQMIEAGLLIHGEGSRSPTTGFAIGSCSRSTTAPAGRSRSGGGRWSRSPRPIPRLAGAPLFHEGSLLYDRPGAEGRARSRRLMVVEGCIDAVAVSEAGFPSGRALGTALTADHAPSCGR